MKASNIFFLGLGLLGTSLAGRIPRQRVLDDDDPLQKNQRVTAFVNTDDGLQVECWELSDLTPDSRVLQHSQGGRATARGNKLTPAAGNIEITLFSFAPSLTLFSFSHMGLHSSAIDFREAPNLFTLKDGIISITSTATANSKNATITDDDEYSSVFADLNGDDWFYFEDQYTGDHKPVHAQTDGPVFTMKTVSGSDTTLINFVYPSTPPHNVLHKGTCNFAGLTPVDDSNGINRGTESSDL